MSAYAKTLLAVVLAAGAMVVYVGSASAGRLSSTERSFIVSWEALSFVAEGGTTVRCPVILGGSFYSATLQKVREATVGDVRMGIVTESLCTGGSATFLDERMPWHIRYRSFSGSLPSITGISVALIDAAVRVEVSGISCLYRTTTTEPQLGRLLLSSGRANELEALEEGRIRGSGGFCFLRGAMSGATGAPPRETTVGTVRLI